MALNLSPDQRDALCELVNIGVGRAAASLSELIGSRIVLTVPTVTLHDFSGLKLDPVFGGDVLSTAVWQNFDGVFSGRAVLVFPHAAGRKLGQLLGGLDTLPDGADPDLCGILSEVGNIVLNGVLGALANTVQAHLRYSVPRCSSERSLRDLLADLLAPAGSEQAAALVTTTEFRVADSSINGWLLTLFEPGSFERILATLDSLFIAR